ncbi:hypothetical protein QQS21_010821 [Conoideocrella luteorostrata]|uniref:protein disulfide-isomerase n=1 Tax=Conoideocrella luteorostrata TaxID=1105319 RepID=A0AAJ0CEJ4_9HYPO|nr:hypothetical protein QQS21_010821 [Conoideocrella luteorostrata]
MARYRGPRTAASIASFFRRRQQPAVTRLSGSELTPFSTGDDFVFVAHFQHSNDALSDRFTAIAEVYRDRYTFGYLGDQGQEANSIRCFNNIDGLQYVETSLTRIGAIDRFVETCTEPLIPPLTRKSEAKHTQTGKSLVHYFTNDKSDRDLYVEKMRPLAKTYQEYLTFVTVDVTEYQDMPRAMGLKSDKGLVVENTRNGQVFPFRGSSGPINAEDIETFITAISRGKIPSWTGQDKSPGSLGTEEARDEL